MSSAGGAGWDPDSLDPELRQELAQLLGWKPAEHYRAQSRFDPHANLLDWALQPAEPQAFAHAARASTSALWHAVHHLALQGVPSQQTPVRAANAYHATLGLSPALPTLDHSDPEVAAGHETSAAVLLPQAGFGAVKLPNWYNQTKPGLARTAVLVQLPAPPGTDGHRVLFTSKEAWRLVRCFLQSWRDGNPTVGGTGECSD
ncbi:MAG: hypothetical protein FJ100_08435 [Deltaproteobacteria bacterium]|nr:hypothetical protein [Deltaproteobacteria bacterium]